MTAFAHGGQDLMQDLKDNKSRLVNKQLAFYQLSQSEERMDNLQSQVDYLKKNITLIEKLMEKEFPHVKKKMSMYKLDYIDELKKNLKKLEITIVQIKQTIH
jgi:hypothetical protein